LPTTLQAAILGVVQGATEFLPVSSSAHLILARTFFGFDGDKFGLAFDVACHVGTLIAVLIYFRDDVMRMIAAVPQLFRPGVLRPAEAGRDDSARMIWLLVVGTIPAVIVGLLFNKLIEERLRTPEVAAAMLAIGGVLFFVAERLGAHRRTDASLTVTEVLLIGCAQALALVPGVSRSGTTIAVAPLLGLRRPDAALFIFLLAIPAILAAAAKEAPRMLEAGMAGDEATLFLIGVVFSAIVGYFVVKFFIHYLQKHTLDLFGWYRIALAASVALWFVAR
jgi:undecaprenyl-diphosphatase